MTNKENSTKANGTNNPASLDVQFPIFYRIPDGDTDSIKHHKSNGTPIAKISLKPGLPTHFYAIIAAKSQAEADFFNREFNNMDRKESRMLKKWAEHETSYDIFVESGIDLSVGYVNPEKHQVADLSKCKMNDPAEIVAYKTVIEALNKELSELTTEKLRICEMVATKTPERTVAKEMGIRQSTLNGRKNSTLKDLRHKMIDFK